MPVLAGFYRSLTRAGRRLMEGMAVKMVGRYGTCWAKQKTIGEDVGHRRETANRFERFLEAKGFIVVFRREPKLAVRLPNSTGYGAIRPNARFPAVAGQITSASSASTYAALGKIRASVKANRLLQAITATGPVSSGPWKSIAALQEPPVSGPLAASWNLPTLSGAEASPPKPFACAPFSAVQVLRPEDPGQPPGPPPAPGGVPGQTPLEELHEDPVDRSPPIEQGAAQDRKAAPEPQPEGPTEAARASRRRSPGESTVRRSESLPDRRNRELAERLAAMKNQPK